MNNEAKTSDHRGRGYHRCTQPDGRYFDMCARGSEEDRVSLLLIDAQTKLFKASDSHVDLGGYFFELVFEIMRVDL